MKELFLINKTYKHIISISCTLDMLVKYFNIYDCMILYDLNKLCGLLVPKRRLAIILKRKHRLYRIINILFFNYHCRFKYHLCFLITSISLL